MPRVHSPSASRPPSAAATLADDAAAALLYFDIFGHPLTLAETHAFLPNGGVSLDELRDAVLASPAIECHGTADLPLFTVRGRPTAWAGQRRTKERQASRLFTKARRMARLMSAFPFVRALFISGSLSKGVVDLDADIDWFVVAEPGRLWVCKTFLALFRRVALFNQTSHLCTNYFVSAKTLGIIEQNIYTATEIATARPVTGGPLIDRFFAENQWIRNFLPNYTGPDRSMELKTPVAAAVQRLAELAFTGRFGAWLDEHCLAAHVAFQKRRYAAASAHEFDMMFRSTPTECRIHKRKFHWVVMNAYANRLREFGLTRKIKEE